LAGAQCVKTMPRSHCVLLSRDSSYEAVAGIGNARRAITSVVTAHLAVAVALHQALAQAVAGQHAAQPLPLVLLVAAPERRRAREEGRRPVHMPHRLGRAAGQAARDGARQLQWHGGLARRACSGHFRFERQQARQASAPLSAHAQVQLAHRQPVTSSGQYHSQHHRFLLSDAFQGHHHLLVRFYQALVSAVLEDSAELAPLLLASCCAASTSACCKLCAYSASRAVVAAPALER